MPWWAIIDGTIRPLLVAHSRQLSLPKNDRFVLLLGDSLQTFAFYIRQSSNQFLERSNLCAYLVLMYYHASLLDSIPIWRVVAYCAAFHVNLLDPLVWWLNDLPPKMHSESEFQFVPNLAVRWREYRGNSDLFVCSCLAGVAATCTVHWRMGLMRTGWQVRPAKSLRYDRSWRERGR